MKDFKEFVRFYKASWKNDWKGSLLFHAQLAFLIAVYVLLVKTNNVINR